MSARFPLRSPARRIKIELAAIALCVSTARAAAPKDLNINPRDATAAGVVFLDANANGKRDPNEPGLPDVRISDGEVLKKTGSGGEYRFELKIDWHRFVFVVRPTGYKPTTAYAVRLAGDGEETNYAINFGLAKDPASQPGKELAFLVTADSQFVTRDFSAVLDRTQRIQGDNEWKKNAMAAKFSWMCLVRLGRHLALGLPRVSSRPRAGQEQTWTAQHWALEAFLPIRCRPEFVGKCWESHQYR